jgi:hypothetical protein
MFMNGLGAVARVVQHLCREILAGAALAREQHCGRRARGNLLQQRLQLRNRPRRLRQHFGAAQRRHIWIERDLQHAIALMAEEIEGVCDVLERKAVRDEGRQIVARCAIISMSRRIREKWKVESKTTTTY